LICKLLQVEGTRVATGLHIALNLVHVCKWFFSINGPLSTIAIQSRESLNPIPVVTPRSNYNLFLPYLSGFELKDSAHIENTRSDKVGGPNVATELSKRKEGLTCDYYFKPLLVFH